MENVNSTVVWQEQTWWPTADGPMFLLWSRYLASPSVFTHQTPPSIFPPPPPPASPDQLYQHDKSPGKTRVSSPLPAHLSEVFYFLTRVLGITETLCLHLGENTRCTRSLSHISRLFPASIPSVLKILLPRDESAALRHCWFGAALSGRC